MRPRFYDRKRYPEIAEYVHENFMWEIVKGKGLKMKTFIKDKGTSDNLKTLAGLLYKHLYQPYEVRTNSKPFHW